MLRMRIQMLLLLGLAVTSVPYAPFVAAQNSQWSAVDSVKVLIDSTADWGRIMFDDLNGTNTNGLRIKSVLDSGWLTGKDPSDVLDVGRKIAWPDQDFDKIITRHGDMVSFFKGVGNFHYTEAYADIVLEVDASMPQLYVWLMTGGNGTTTFEIVSQTTGGTIWRDVIVGSGETQQVRRVLTPQPFFRTGRTENVVVEAWLSIVIIVIIILNFPLLEALSRNVQRRRGNARARKREKEASE